MKRGGDTVGFLRMAAVELRNMAAAAPDIRDQLCHLAEQLEAEADALSNEPED